jgi:RNA polymerase sigma-54 factor
MFQSLKLMSLPLQDLKMSIQEELERNPALEMLEDRSAVSLEAAEKPPKEYDAFENSSDPGYLGRLTSGPVDEEGSDAKQKFIEALSRRESLQDHLLWQLGLQPLEEDERALGTLLIQNLDKNGFFFEAPESFIPPRLQPLAPKITALIQGFDPTGCCAADYGESLLVQCRLDPLAPPEAEALIRDHLKMVDQGRVKEAAKSLGVSADRMDLLLDYLRTLNPTPGAAYSTGEVSYVTPDLMIYARGGDFVISINDEEIPVLGINPYFEKLMETRKGKKAQEAGQDARQFAAEQVRDAQAFLQGLQYRNQTLLRVAQVILEFQRDFFIRGPKYLAPMTLKEAAEAISVHESTVSRLANAKHIQTEWGIFPLRYFFSNSVPGSENAGPRISREGVKERIREIIAAEKGKKLPDQRIAEILTGQGIKVARRTVAKYRSELEK